MKFLLIIYLESVLFIVSVIALERVIHGNNILDLHDAACRKGWGLVLGGLIVFFLGYLSVFQPNSSMIIAVKTVAFLGLAFIAGRLFWSPMFDYFDKLGDRE